VGIVAVARRLLIALWRYLNQGMVPDGAEFKSTLGKGEKNKERDLDLANEPVPRLGFQRRPS
jgi:hypothetical protein